MNHVSFLNGSGQSIQAFLTYTFEGGRAMAVFDCEVDLSINWDISRITVFHNSTEITILTGRENLIKNDGQIGKQLLEITAERLKDLLCINLSLEDRMQIDRLAQKNIAQQASPKSLQEQSSYSVIVKYKHIRYQVNFSKQKNSSDIDMVWDISYLRRISLLPEREN